jgi:uncharacterized protein (DUF1697 family)
MSKYLALLRGINVSGTKNFTKAEQLQVLDALGFANPQVYIHTGNWVFETKLSSKTITQKIQEAILNKQGWEVPIIVRTALEVEAILANCPFPLDIREKTYFTLLLEQPTEEKVQLLETKSYPNETILIADRCIYSFPVLGAGRAKMTTNFFENTLKVSATSRNFKTMTKLLALCSDS